MVDWGKLRSGAGRWYVWGRDVVAVHPGVAVVIIVVDTVLIIVGWLL